MSGVGISPACFPIASCLTLEPLVPNKGEPLAFHEADISLIPSCSPRSAVRGCGVPGGRRARGSLRDLVRLSRLVWEQPRSLAFLQRAEMYTSFRRVHSAKLQNLLLGWRALTGTNAVTAHDLFPALERQHKNTTPLKKKHTACFKILLVLSKSKPDLRGWRRRRRRHNRQMLDSSRRHWRALAGALALQPVPLILPSSVSPAAGLTAPTRGGRPGLHPARGFRERGISGLVTLRGGWGPVSPDLPFSSPSQRYPTEPVSWNNQLPCEMGGGLIWLILF